MIRALRCGILAVALTSFGLAAAPSLGAEPARVQPASFAAAIAAIVARPAFAHAIVAAEVYDLDARRPIYARGAQTLMEAASTTKLVTTGTALALLGPGFTFTTPVYRTGPIDAAGVVHGDLVLVASGDPNLSQRIQPDGSLAFENEDHSYDGTYDTRAVPGDPLAVLRDLAAQVARSGVRQIDGRVVVDASLFADAGPEAGTGAIVSPIVVNDNLVDVTVTPGARSGDPVALKVSPQTAYVTFVSQATTAAAGTEPSIDFSADKTNADGSHTVTVTGTQPAGRAMLYAYRVPEPARFAQDAFAATLRAARVGLNPPSPSRPFDPAAAAGDYIEANRVAEHVSPPLSQDVYVTLKVSDNLHAALLPYDWAIYVLHAKSDFLKVAFTRENALLRSAGLDVSGAAQQDGLGGSAFFTPDFMVRYLAWARAQAWFAPFRHALPILGVDGTLFNIQTGSPAKGKVFAKTGTWGSFNLLDGDGLVTKGLAGYLTTRHGRHLAFAFYINRMAGRSSVDPERDAAHFAGQTLGEMATDAYLRL
ncbi:MAG TPA: D-alanyl-D-alanine carboxypeptidase/D-alanyl-D-alanine-endopeptidase [Candidatus Tumulicola sp.]|jgi:D-alanyl-D-alanine carboxypeptidase/D-alanyl-D-alanine-endopeptidase (penicillin-binding protein 4)